MLQPGSEIADIARRQALQPRQEFDELFEGPYFGVGPFYEVGVLADEDQDIAGPEKIVKPLGLFARQVEGERDRGTTGGGVRSTHGTEPHERRGHGHAEQDQVATTARGGLFFRNRHTWRDRNEGLAALGTESGFGPIAAAALQTRA